MKNKVCKSNISAYSGEKAIRFDKLSDSRYSNELVEDGVIKLLSNFKKDNLKIIEFGCGSGRMTKYLLKHTKKSKIYYQDISKDCLSILKNKLSKEDLKRTKFICGDATEYFKNCKEKFDLIAVRGALHHIYDYELLLEFSSKRLKKGGIYYIAFEPLPHRYYNYYLKELIANTEKFFYSTSKLRFLYLIYAPFNFLEGILYTPFFEKIKNKCLHGNITNEGSLAEYWENKGVNPDVIYNITKKRNLAWFKFTKIHDEYYFKTTNKVARFFGLKTQFDIILKVK